MINTDELTLGQLKEIQALSCGTTRSAKHPYPTGCNVIIRTVTHYYTGRLIEVFDHEIVLEDAAWIADTGRWAAALESGSFGEVEPYPKGRRVIVGRGAIIDCSELSGNLPTETK